MRVPDSVLAAITERISIADVVGAYVTLKNQGNRLVGLCPFHAEKSPSFTVTPDKGLFYCFGCHKGGNIFTFVMEIEKVPFLDAVTMLAERAGISLDVGGDSESERRASALKELYNRVAGSFTYILNSTKAGELARAYLAGRGVDRTTEEAFRLGFAPADRSWLYGFLSKKSYSEAFLAQSGLFSKRYPSMALFGNRVMFPIANSSGEVVAFGGRALEAEGGAPKYINSPETGIFRKGETLFGLDRALPSIRSEGYFILVEGYMDVLAMHQAGITSAVAPLGTAFTEQQARRLRRYVERGVLVFDGDSAGSTATAKSIAACEREGIRTEVVELPADADPADILRNEGAGALHNLVKYPINSFEYLVAKSIERHNPSSPEEKETVIRELSPYIDVVESEVRREGYIARLAGALGADAGAVARDIAGLARRGGERRIDTLERNTVPISQELYLVIAATVKQGAFPYVRSRLTIDDFVDARARELWAALEECFRKGDTSADCVLSGVEDGELRERVLEKLSSDEFVTNQEQVIRQSVNTVKTLSLARKRREVEERLRRAQASGASDEAISELQADKMFFDSELQKLKVNENDRAAN